LKSSISKLYLIILALFICTFCVGCNGSNQTVYPQDTVVVVNGAPISENDIKAKTIQREIGIKMVNMLRENDANFSKTQTEGILMALGRTEDQLTGDEKRYIASLERSSIYKPIDINLIFNLMVREEVLYQEAVQQGYIVSNEKTHELQKQANEASDQATLSDPDSAKEYDQIMAYETAVLKEFGFNSRSDYEEWVIPKAARSSTIRLMQNNFDQKIAGQYPELSWLPLRIAQYNAWEDYTEFLLKQSSIDIRQANYVLDYYGTPWEMGRLDLK